MSKGKYKQISIYWLCQIMGWGSVGLYWTYHQIKNQATFWQGLFAVGIPLIGSLLITHLYRNISHQKGWVKLNLSALITPMLIALVGLTAIYILFAYLGYIAAFSNYTLPIFMGMLSGGIRYMAIWLLVFHMYHYAHSSRQSEIDETKFEKLAIAAQYNQLNAELNPHFLFNSLNSIKALVTESPEKAREAIDLLSDILRSALDHSNHRVISLEEELKKIKSYLAIEKIRFEERLTYSFDIDAEVMQSNVPPLSLYNLVENAVKHGMSQSTIGGHIKINAFSKNSKLELEVINDGSLQVNPGIGVGLKNIAERIKLLYGTSASISLLAIPENLVKARLSLPLT